MTATGTKILDLLLIILGLALAIGSTHLLTDNQRLEQWSSVRIKKMRPQIGVVMISSNDTRRRSRGSLSWFPLNNQQKIFEQDTIFSGVDSSASITINDEASSYKIEIGGNTLVQFLQVDGSPLVNLQLGSIASNLGKGEKLKVKFGKKTSIVKAQKNDTQIHLISTDGKQTSIAVESGELAVEGLKGSTKLDSEKLLEINEEGDVVIKSKISLMSPKQGEILVPEPSQKVKFVWKESQKVSDQTSYKIEFSKNQDFSKKIFQQEVSGQSLEFGKRIKNGSYFWRVTQIENPEVQSQIAGFSVYQKNSLNLQFPPDQFHQSFDKENSPVKINFSWEPFPKTKKYRLELSSTENFSQEITQKETLDNFITEKFSFPGSTYWRVVAILSNNAEVTSPIRQFSVGEDNILPSPPLPDVTPPPVEPPPPAEPPPPETPIAKKVEDPFSKAKIDWDPPENITKMVDPQKMDTTYDLEVTWASEPRGQNVEATLVSAKKSIRPQKTISKNSRANFKLTEAGRYAVRLRHLRSNGRPVTQSERKARFSYSIKYKVATPKLRQPANQVQLVAFGDEPISIYFDWAKIPYAENYELQVASDKSFEKIISEKKLKDNNFYLNKNLNHKSLYWRVRTKFKDTYSEWTPYRIIYISGKNEG